MGDQVGPVPQRIGDVERDRAADLLREHLALGRLTAEEFDDRLGRALSARTSADLDPLFSDLPGPRPGQTVTTTQPLGTAPWQHDDTAPAPARAPRCPGLPASGGLIGMLWLVVPLAITFALPGGWGRFWWLIFLPLVVSMVLGKGESERGRQRTRGAPEQERLDRHRRALGD